MLVKGKLLLFHPQLSGPIIGVLMPGAGFLDKLCRYYLDSDYPFWSSILQPTNHLLADVIITGHRNNNHHETNSPTQITGCMNPQVTTWVTSVCGFRQLNYRHRTKLETWNRSEKIWSELEENYWLTQASHKHIGYWRQEENSKHHLFSYIFYRKVHIKSWVIP